MYVSHSARHRGENTAGIPRFAPGHSYTAPMRVWTSLLIIFFAASCGGHQPTKGESVVLPDEEGIYTSRYNPISCTDPESFLSVEVRTALGWERVRLEDSDPDLNLVITLMNDFQKAPHKVRLLRGNFSRRSFAFGQGHASRVFMVQTLDPEPNADDPNRSVSP